MLVDSHCHLDLDTTQAPEALIEAALAQRIEHMLCVAIDLAHFPTIRTLAEQHESVFASVGIHPNTPLTAEEEPDVDTLVTLADHPRVVAIGETGLDYFRSEGDLAWQHNRFRTHIAAAKETKKPLIIHTRDAKEDTLRILAEENAAEVGGVMHCFVEDWETAKAAMDMNFYISFSGIVTFKSAKTLQDVAKRMPLDRLLVETDSPYLAPVPYRGKTNQPAYVYHVAEFLAALRDQPLSEIAAATTENFFNLFHHAQAKAI